jgi:hypothetical protein
MIFILDACSAINLLHIFKDDDELLKNIFDNNRIEITEKVNNEINDNLFNNKLEIDSIMKQNIRDVKNIVIKVSNDEDENSQIYLNEVTNYNKTNGEFYSSALALNLNRLENDYVYFVSDDIPAHNEFKDFFNYNKIGSIITTADFLFRYYLYSDSFSLINYLLNLKAQYLIIIKKFESEIEKLENNTSLKVKDKYILKSFVGLLKNIDIKNIIDFELSTKVSRIVMNHIEKIQIYFNNFNANEKRILEEIDNYLKIIENKQYYRL